MVARKHFAFVVLLTPVASKAQQTTKYYNILWASYNSTIHINHKWALTGDAQLRTINWAKNWLMYGLRSGVSYNLNKGISFATGFTLFRYAQYAGINLFFKNEWRPWEEIAYNLKPGKKVDLFQRLRAEQRFLQLTVNNTLKSSYQYIFRLRYRFEWQFPITQQRIKLTAGNEIFVNPGYLNTQLLFDQNRTFAGFNFKLNSNSILQTQYMKIFQWRNSTSVLENQNVIRINFVQQFNIKKLN